MLGDFAVKDNMPIERAANSVCDRVVMIVAIDQGSGAPQRELQPLTIRKATAATDLAIVLPSPGAERQWPRFRGPSGQGDTDPTGLPTVWDQDGRNIVWRTRVPGLGNSSPIVWGDDIFLTSADPNGTERFVHCFSRQTGKLRWTRQAPARPPEPIWPKNGFASSTPVTDGERVIAFLQSFRGWIGWPWRRMRQWLGRAR